MAEWLNAADLKSAVPLWYRGFESHRLRRRRDGGPALRTRTAASLSGDLLVRRRNRVSAPAPPPWPRKLLLVRDDRLGDFMLAWPAFALLRTALADTRIVALVPEYTAGIARLCPSLDDLLVVPDSVRDWKASDELTKRLADDRYDAVISFFSHYYTARAFRRARIPVRLAPAVKLAQILHTHRLPQHRSRSLQPEYRYNLDLAAYALTLWGRPLPEAPSGPYLTFPSDQRREHRREIFARHRIAEGSRLVALHPGHRGSAHNLSVEGYADVGRAAANAEASTVLLVTCGPGLEEREKAQKLCSTLEGEGIRVRLHDASSAIERFALDLTAVDVFLSGSTGPLHLAACLGVPTVGFFPEKRSASAIRWRPPGAPEDHLAITCPLDRTHGVLAPPDSEQREEIRSFLLRRAAKPL